MYVGREEMRKMLTAICLIWIGVKLEASSWYFGLVALSLLVRAINAYRYATRRKRRKRS